MRPPPRSAWRARAAVPVLLGLVATLAALVGLPAAAPGAATVARAVVCPPPEDLGLAIASGQVVIVGTVERAENQGRWATVRVEERWYGASGVPDTVQVRGGPEPGTATSADRSFVTGQRYLFVARAGAGVLEDNLCTPTRPWTDDLAQYRPRGVDPVADRPPVVPIVDVPPDVLPILGLFGALFVAVIAYWLVLRARRRPPDWMR
jgi:hypothetical protein